ncbi:MAG: antibiotic acetyltransferase [Lactobacillaceae bacterium]|jgi:acetyltransferase-like isoleucine patch superfamily enzyme|nr:antibiotic acetyltransferase [Lactobacillaceae bacterium]
MSIRQKIARAINKRKVAKEFEVRFGKRTNVSKNAKFEGHNDIDSGTTFSNSSIGIGSFIGRDSYIVNTKIGRFSSIGSNVKIIVGNHPLTQFVSTHPAFYSTRAQAGFTFVDEQLFSDLIYVENTKSSVIIGSDVWIGDDVKILNGVQIGNGAVIAAGAVVVKDVAPFEIVGGVPAKHIKNRYTPAQIQILNETRWFDRDFEWIKTNHEQFSDQDKFFDFIKN